MIMKLLRSTWVLATLCAALAIATAGLSWRTIELGAKVTESSTAAAAKAAQHRRDMAKAERERRTATARHRNEIAKMKAKARLRRFVIAIPLLGAGAVVYFERRDYREWKEEHPNGTIDGYGAEVAAVSADVVDEVLQELPESMRPEPDRVSRALSASLRALRRVPD